MSLTLANFQFLWGKAGAREKFEDMVSQLIHVEMPDSQRVRICLGDGGLDSIVGNLTDPAGIDVYQVKYFPDRLGESQKQQIRESFRTVRESEKFKVKSWTLCLPIDMSVDEIRWFEGWSKSQADSGIDIRRIWGEIHIKGLLLQEKNRSIRESFFRDENTELLRAVHGNSEKILTGLKQQGDRNLKVRIDPIWNGNLFQAQIRLFNSGKGAIYIDSWSTEWNHDGKQGLRQSGQTVRGSLPIRLQEHEPAEFRINVESDVESLSRIGVYDGDGHLWHATDEDLAVFKHKAIAQRLPGTDELAEEAPFDGNKVEVKASATRPAGMAHDRLEVAFTNLNDHPVSVYYARLGWKYTPPRESLKLPGKPHVSEIGGNVSLTRQGKPNPIGSGEQVLFVLSQDMSDFLVEIARGDVLDEDIVIDFTSDGKMGWRASMDELPSVVRRVANSVVKSKRHSRQP